MPVTILGSSVRTCLGDGESTFCAALDGRAGVGPLRCGDPGRLNVDSGYHIVDDDERAFQATSRLVECVTEAVTEAGIRPAEHRTAAVVGTGLRELRAVELATRSGSTVPSAEDLHFESALQDAVPGLDLVLTVSTACSAGGHALALAQDLIELDRADIVIVGGTDGMTESMLSMIGRVTDDPADRVRPFDAQRAGVLLGEGTAALVVADQRLNHPAPLGRVLATGLSCDAQHETALVADGIRRAVSDAFSRADRVPREVDVVFAHGTGTALNDPVEADVLTAIVPEASGPMITALKGTIGHTSGASALHSVDTALRCLRTDLVPPVVGLHDPIPEARSLRLVRDTPSRAPVRLAQVDAFGFGGVNSVTLVEAAS